MKYYAARLKKAGIIPNSLIVFGSHAKGTNKPFSDIDVCVVSKKFGKNRHTEMVRLLHLTDDKTMDIEPHPYHPSDLKNKWDPLAAEILRYGIVFN
ncbi:MAG: nucleotidyltransferase domain-containing protein [Patescibacteria group bacterium]|nr:nucleotidyltransferase domain-containing protein [Patescibacteria group bacterium]